MANMDVTLPDLQGVVGTEDAVAVSIITLPASITVPDLQGAVGTCYRTPYITALSSPAAPGGSLTITGFGFGASRGNSVVKIGVVTVTAYTSWSDTSIVCTIPLAATSGYVGVYIGS